MTNTQRLLERARALCDPPTWYQLHKRTAIAHTTISRCMKKGGTLDNEGVLRLSKFLHEDFQTLLVLIELDRARTPEKRQFWEHVAPRVLPTIVAAVLLASAGAPSDEGYVTQGRNVTYCIDQANYYAQLMACADTL